MIWVILFPPMAALLYGGVFSAIFNVVFLICGVIPGYIHAYWLVSKYHADQRHKELLAAVTAESKKKKR